MFIGSFGIRILLWEKKPVPYDLTLPKETQNLLEVRGFWKRDEFVNRKIVKVFEAPGDHREHDDKIVVERRLVRGTKG